MSIKAIETIYNGYKFRSRLEARWAVFFDALGVKYEYEKEGFDLEFDSLGNGKPGYYLPDFWLPTFEAWLEVKGQPLTNKEENKCIALHVEGINPVLVGVGEPYFGNLLLYCHDSTDSSGGLGIWDNCQWAANLTTRRLCVGVDNHSHKDDRTWMNADWEFVYWIDDKDNLELEVDAILYAGRAARQARFEHGE